MPWAGSIQRIMGRKKQAERKEEITVVACTKCDYTQERGFAAGDFVMKPSQSDVTCPSCNGAMFIKRIFARVSDT